MNPLSKLYEDNRAHAGRYAVSQKDETSAEVMIYDVIGGFWGLSAAEFVKDVKAIKASTIHLRINSPGGEVDAARAMSTALSQHPARVIAHVDGLAASAASFVMLAADEIEISSGAFVMVHYPWGWTVGNEADHLAGAELLRKYGDASVRDYMRRTGKDEKTVRDWLEAETWFTAEEAVAAGLADRVVEIVTAKAEANQKWNLSAYRNAPVALCAGGVDAKHEVPGSAPADNPIKEGSMSDPTTVESTGQNPAVQAGIAAAVAAETRRASEITRIGTMAHMPPETVQAAISNKTSVEAFKDAVIEAKFREGTQVETRVGAASGTITRDETDTRRMLMTSAVLNRVDGVKFAVDQQNGYKFMSLLRMAEESIAQQGINTRGMSANDIAIKAMHSTSDFPYVLENSLRKVLLNNYEMVETTYKKWTKKSIATDFKTMRRIRRGDMPVFLEVAEGGEILMGTVGEERESYAIATYGRGVTFTRQMLINDDLGAFNDLAGGFGEQAARLENKTVYAILTANAAMNDGVTLFHANHGNSGTGAIGNTGLASMFTGMARQTGVDGVTVKNMRPRYLLVPPELENTARTSQIAIGPNVKATDQNHYAGRLEVVVDAELTDTTDWYGASADGCIEYSHLAGAEGPQFVREENTGGVLGVRFYAYLDFGAKATDWRGLWYSTGS